MDFNWTEDERAFADGVSALLRDACTDERLRQHDEGDASLSTELWASCTELGLMGLCVPEVAGGLGLGWTAAAAVLEQQGQALAPLPLADHLVGSAVVASLGDALHAQRVDQAVNGQRCFVLGLEDLHGTAGPLLTLERSGAGWVLSGQVRTVPMGPVGHTVTTAVVAARHGDGTRLVVLDLDREGLALEHGRTQHHAAVVDVSCNRLAMSEGEVLPPQATAWALERATAALAALQIGVSQRQLERTVEYVSERKQFGRVIGSFQLVTGQMADAQIALEALRSAQAELLYRLDAGLAAASTALTVKVLSSQAGFAIGHAAQHVHGGIGVDLSYPIHRYLYWSRVLAHRLGGQEAALERLGLWLAEDDHLGWRYDRPEAGAAAAGGHA